MFLFCQKALVGLALIAQTVPSEIPTEPQHTPVLEHTFEEASGRMPWDPHFEEELQSLPKRFRRQVIKTRRNFVQRHWDKLNILVRPDLSDQHAETHLALQDAFWNEINAAIEREATAYAELVDHADIVSQQTYWQYLHNWWAEALALSALVYFVVRWRRHPGKGVHLMSGAWRFGGKVAWVTLAGTLIAFPIYRLIEYAFARPTPDEALYMRLEILPQVEEYRESFQEALRNAEALYPRDANTDTQLPNEE